MSRKNETRAILGMALWETPGVVVPGPQLCARAGITRQAVWKTMEKLQTEGFPVEVVPRRGYRLRQDVPDVLHPLWLALAAATLPTKAAFEVFDEVTSTQQVARERARQGAPAPTVVLAERQSAGRGRHGRIWVSPRGCGIYMSVLLRPQLAPSQASLLSLAAGLAVRRGVFRRTGMACDLKWPNDLLRGNGKVCGILTEVASDPDHIHFAVVGMGVNVNFSEQRDPEGTFLFPPAFLQQDASVPVHRGWLVVAILEELMPLVAALECGGAEALVAAYAANCTTLGRCVRMLTDQGSTEGTAKTLSPEGALVVETSEGLRTFTSADVLHASRSS